MLYDLPVNQNGSCILLLSLPQIGCLTAAEKLNSAKWEAQMHLLSIHRVILSSDHLCFWYISPIALGTSFQTLWTYSNAPKHFWSKWVRCWRYRCSPCSQPWLSRRSGCYVQETTWPLTSTKTAKSPFTTWRDDVPSWFCISGGCREQEWYRDKEMTARGVLNNTKLLFRNGGTQLHYDGRLA